MVCVSRIHAILRSNGECVIQMLPIKIKIDDWWRSDDRYIVDFEYIYRALLRIYFSLDWY